jgi:hypothetical protein
MAECELIQNTALAPVAQYVADAHHLHYSGPDLGTHMLNDDDGERLMRSTLVRAFYEFIIQLQPRDMALRMGGSLFKLHLTIHPAPAATIATIATTATAPNDMEAAPFLRLDASGSSRLAKLKTWAACQVGWGILK